MNSSHFDHLQSPSEDDLLLQNFGPQDILHDFCKVESDPEFSGVYVKHENHDMEAQDQINSHKEIRQELRQNGHSKEKKKVFYRDKMAELLKPGEKINLEYKYTTYGNVENKGPLSKEQQLKRNRESAKNSRQRKKQYVTQLQRKNNQNTKLIEELIHKLEQVTLERDRLKEVNHQEIKNFYRSKAEAYEKLQNTLNQPIVSSEDIKSIIDDMRNRFGTSGSERVSVTNYYMNEIIQVIVSDVHKYFLNCSLFSQGFSSRNPPKSIDQDVMRILNLDVTKLNSMMSKFKGRFVKESTVFKDLTQELYRIFKSIENQGKVIQYVFSEMMQEFDSKTLGSLIVWFEENKFCREVKRVRREWTDTLKKGEEEIQVIRKQTKHDYSD